MKAKNVHLPPIRQSLPEPLELEEEVEKEDGAANKFVEEDSQPSLDEQLTMLSDQDCLQEALY